ncbi:SOS-response transcriptional repressor LexA (RecA-mediated autopeptidase) (LexA) [Fructobacillus fructosus]|uniref:LexA family protein n=1 Tax=Fructobacillus fructosus TaxID=1631 RepID=UPI000219572F|nr:S24 family peptidase [Fructobacillus fructosus]KRN52400.1 XRE family transcriptional regulator [Fructobacillus fructosus KCTC 3544]GAP01980.1 hypothetical protein FFRU_210030 [Fructobacillus fructosus]CAK1247326.1 SOS-response transcriptional repressor LexA (RecA-mediated autopeptidase) (LexA) [Fructobacillus fructosus]
MLNNNQLAIKISQLKGSDSYREMSQKTHGKVSHSYFNTLINGDTRNKQPIKPSPDKLRAIADAYSLKTSYKELMTLANYDDDVQNIPNELTISSTPSTVSIPIYGRISAGYPEGAKEDIEGDIDVPNRISNRYSSDELIALRVNGESMNKVIPNGAVAILAKIDKCDITNGDICGVIIDGEAATLKHVYQYPDRIRFEPDSWLKEEFKPFEYNKEDVENGQPPIQIIGKLVHQQSSF